MIKWEVWEILRPHHVKITYHSGQVEILNHCRKNVNHYYNSKGVRKGYALKGTGSSSLNDCN